jgi:hypothetical protein
MANSASYYFVIVGHNDQPVFEIEFPVPDPKRKKEHDVRHLHQFIAHAALDIVDQQSINSGQMYLKVWFYLDFIFGVFNINFYVVLDYR